MTATATSPPDVDAAWMRQALALAEQGRLAAPPNPSIGCVLMDPAGRCIGQGFTQPPGQAHAEVMALRDAQANGHSTRAVTAYVTLEPCAHTGRTGPCCDALIAAGVGRVVAAMQDPNPLVAGQGFARLRAAGVAVEVGLLEQDARAINVGFFHRMAHGTPWVRVKSATSLDGISALPDGQSQWITGAEARADGHRWRARACAVLTGIGTVLADDPRLDVRAVDTPRQPALAIVDSQLRTPTNAQVFRAKRPVWIYTASQDADRIQALQSVGAKVLVIPAADGRVDLRTVLQHLAAQSINEVHVEAGARLNGSLIEAGLANELLLYLAPCLLGQGIRCAELNPPSNLLNRIALSEAQLTPVGADWRVLAKF